MSKVSTGRRVPTRRRDQRVAAVCRVESSKSKDVEPAYADPVASIINGQHRHSLGYEGPAALYAATAVQ